MGKNTHFTSETNAQIVALHAVGHQTKEIMDLTDYPNITGLYFTHISAPTQSDGYTILSGTVVTGMIVLVHKCHTAAGS